MINYLDFPENLQILVIAPFPSASKVQEGWMSRIAMVDNILATYSRLYLHFAPHHSHGRDDVLVQHTENAWEICISPEDSLHRAYVDQLMDMVNGVYVHTAHLAEYIEEWLPSGKIVVDMHGIVPEEETMMGRPHLAPKYERIEQSALKFGKKVVVVTHAMQHHFEKKYPHINANFYVMPIIELYPSINRELGSKLELPVKALYAGGRQVWQNLDATLQLATDTQEFSTFLFLSHEYELIKYRANELKLSVQANYGFRNKKELPTEYARHDFGLVLRDDNAVNRVSCPTKLSEYLDFGLIPVIRSPSLGDFLTLGYAYVTEEDFRRGLIPDQASRVWMREANKAVIYKLRNIFGNSIKEIREWFI